MKVLKILSIIGIVLASISYLCMAFYVNSDPIATIGWGVITTLYLLALSIVGVVKSGK